MFFFNGDNDVGDVSLGRSRRVIIPHLALPLLQLQQPDHYLLHMIIQYHGRPSGHLHLLLLTCSSSLSFFGSLPAVVMCAAEN